MTDQIHLAVWRDCETCGGDGRHRMPMGDQLAAVSGLACDSCGGRGKRATYIPIDWLLNSGTALPSLCAIRDWMRGHDRAVDHRAAELDASGPVPDTPPKVSGVEDRVRAVPLEEDDTQPPGREEFAKDRDHLTVSGTFQSDKYKWCPAGFVPLKLTDPAARDLLAIYAVRRKPIDEEFPRDLIEALANVPEKPNPKYGPMPPLRSGPLGPCPTCGRIEWKWNHEIQKWFCEPCTLPHRGWPEHPAKSSHPEDGVTAMVRALLKRACLDDKHQVEYVMEGLVPIFQQVRYEDRPSPSSDLAVAARHLVDLVIDMKIITARKSCKTALMLALANVMESLDGRGVEPDKEGS